MIYYSIFLYITFFCIREQISKYHSINFHHFLFLLFLLFFIGLRYEIGVDWFAYLSIYKQIGILNLNEAIGHDYSILYYLVNWLGFNLNLNIWFVNLICSFFFLLGIFYVMKSSPYPWLILLISFPYTILAFSMNYTRQSAAFGLTLVVLYFLCRKKIFKSLFFFILSTQFHISSIILAPVFLFSYVKIDFKKYFFILLLNIFLFFYLYINGYFNSYIHMYLYIKGYGFHGEGLNMSTYGINSEGTPFRLGLNAISGLLFLYFYKIFKINIILLRYMFFSSVISIMVFLFMVIIGPLTIFDRLCLYFMPLQLYFLSYLLYFLNNFKDKYFLKIFIIIFYSFYLIIWFNFTNFHVHWVPYLTFLFN